MQIHAALRLRVTKNTFVYIIYHNTFEVVKLCELWLFQSQTAKRFLYGMWLNSQTLQLGQRNASNLFIVTTELLEGYWRNVCFQYNMPLRELYSHRLLPLITWRVSARFTHTHSVATQSRVLRTCLESKCEIYTHTALRLRYEY